MFEVSMISGVPAAIGARRNPLAATQRRWQILYQQMAEGREPCFQTEQRHACHEKDCPFRAECIGGGLRAEWRR